MTFARIAALINLIGRYQGSNKHNYEIVVIFGVGTERELRIKCSRQCFTKDDYSEDIFCGCPIIINKEVNNQYMAIAYLDGNTGELKQLTEVTEEDYNNGNK